MKIFLLAVLVALLALSHATLMISGFECEIDNENGPFSNPNTKTTKLDIFCMGSASLEFQDTIRYLGAVSSTEVSLYVSSLGPFFNESLFKSSNENVAKVTGPINVLEDVSMLEFNNADINLDDRCGKYFLIASLMVTGTERVVNFTKSVPFYKRCADQDEDGLDLALQITEEAETKGIITLEEGQPLAAPKDLKLNFINIGTAPLNARTYLSALRVTAHISAVSCKDLPYDDTDSFQSISDSITSDKDFYKNMIENYSQVSGFEGILTEDSKQGKALDPNEIVELDLTKLIGPKPSFLNEFQRDCTVTLLTISIDTKYEDLSENTDNNRFVFPVQYKPKTELGMKDECNVIIDPEDDGQSASIIKGPNRKGYYFDGEQEGFRPLRKEEIKEIREYEAEIKEITKRLMNLNEKDSEKCPEYLMENDEKTLIESSPLNYYNDFYSSLSDSINKTTAKNDNATRDKDLILLALNLEMEMAQSYLNDEEFRKHMAPLMAFMASNEKPGPCVMAGVGLKTLKSMLMASIGNPTMGMIFELGMGMGVMGMGGTNMEPEKGSLGGSGSGSGNIGITFPETKRRKRSASIKEGHSYGEDHMDEHIDHPNDDNNTEWVAEPLRKSGGQRRRPGPPPSDEFDIDLSLNGTRPPPRDGSRPPRRGGRGRGRGPSRQDGRGQGPPEQSPSEEGSGSSVERDQNSGGQTRRSRPPPLDDIDLSLNGTRPPPRDGTRPPPRDGSRPLRRGDRGRRRGSSGQPQFEEEPGFGVERDQNSERSSTQERYDMELSLQGESSFSSRHPEGYQSRRSRDEGDPQKNGRPKRRPRIPKKIENFMKNMYRALKTGNNKGFEFMPDSLMKTMTEALEAIEQGMERRRDHSAILDSILLIMKVKQSIMVNKYNGKGTESEKALLSTMVDMQMQIMMAMDSDTSYQELVKKMKDVLVAIKDYMPTAKAMFDGDTTSQELLDFVLDLGGALEENFDQIAMLISMSSSNMFNNRREMRRIPAKLSSAAMPCERAARRYIESDLEDWNEEKSSENSESPFYEELEAFRDPIKRIELPTYWMQYKNGIYRGSGSLTLGVMMWEMVAVCSCSNSQRDPHGNGREPSNQNSQGNRQPSNQNSQGNRQPSNQNSQGNRQPSNQNSQGNRQPSNQNSQGNRQPSNQNSQGGREPINQNQEGFGIPDYKQLGNNPSMQQNSNNMQSNVNSQSQLQNLYNQLQNSVGTSTNSLDLSVETGSDISGSSESNESNERG